MEYNYRTKKEARNREAEDKRIEHLMVQHQSLIEQPNLRDVLNIDLSNDQMEAVYHGRVLPVFNWMCLEEGETELVVALESDAQTGKKIIRLKFRSWDLAYDEVNDTFYCINHKEKIFTLFSILSDTSRHPWLVKLKEQLGWTETQGVKDYFSELAELRKKLPKDLRYLLDSPLTDDELQTLLKIADSGMK